MKNIRKFVLMTLAAFAAISCADENAKPIITFDDAIKGAYVRLLDGGDLLVNLLDVAGSEYVYSVEFVDLQKGALVAEYALELVYQDNDASNGDNSTTVTSFRSYTPADFAVNANGFVGMENISISANDLFTGAGVAEADVSPGDNFVLNGRLVMTDGTVRTAANSSASVNGTAFRGHLSFTMPASCPSSIEGTYNISTTNPATFNSACPAGNTFTGTIDIINDGAGVYSFSDWSFGSYPECYNFCCATGDFNFKDVCTVVTINNGTDSFGDPWEFSSVISGNDWIITWNNVGAYPNEQGVTTITFPDGVPFTLN